MLKTIADVGDPLGFYLSLFSPVHQGKARFMGLASGVLSQAADLVRLLRSAPEVFGLGSAVGVQLDALGELAGMPRPAGIGDEEYRQLLRARIARNHWDGSNGSLPEVLAAAFPGREAVLTDNGDGTVTASLSGEAPFPPADCFPRPAGVRLIRG